MRHSRFGCCGAAGVLEEKAATHALRTLAAVDAAQSADEGLASVFKALSAERAEYLGSPGFETAATSLPRVHVESDVAIIAEEATRAPPATALKLFTSSRMIDAKVLPPVEVKLVAELQIVLVEPVAPEAAAVVSSPLPPQFTVLGEAHPAWQLGL